MADIKGIIGYNIGVKFICVNVAMVLTFMNGDNNGKQMRHSVKQMTTREIDLPI